MTDPESEELLRRWGGQVLANAGAAPPMPVADPEAVEAFLRWHGIEPCISHFLPEHHPARPVALPEFNSRHAIAVEMARTHEFIRVLTDIQGRLPDPPIVYKGQALAHTLYPHPWLRPRGDVDVLVEQTCVSGFLGELQGHGYEKSLSTEGDLLMPQASMRRRHAGIEHVWDVHWGISNRPAWSDFLGYGVLREAAIDVPVDGISFCAPCPAHSLLIACLHLIGHHPGELRLLWLYDIHLLAASLSTGECRRFMDQAMERPQVRAACHAALEATQRYIPGEPTDELRRALDPGPGARWRGGRSYLAGLVEDAAAVAKGKRLRFVTQHVLPSSDYMMKRFGIRHRWQLPFWYVVRIGRAVPKLFRRR